MQTLLNDLDKLQRALATDSLLFGIVLGCVLTLFLLAVGHTIINRNNNNNHE